MQTAPAVNEAAFQTFDAVIYSAIYLVGALWLLVGDRSAAGDSAGRLARALCLAGGLDGAAGRQGVEGLLGRALGDHRADRRQLHQHPVGEAVRAHPLRGGLRRRGDRARARHLRAADADHHADGAGADGDQRLSDRRGDRLRDRAVEPGRRDRRHGGGGVRAGAAAERDDRLDHVVARLAVREHRRDQGGHGDHRPADRAARRRRRGRTDGHARRDRARPGEPPLRPRRRRVARRLADDPAWREGRAGRAARARASRRWST